MWKTTYYLFDECRGLVNGTVRCKAVNEKTSLVNAYLSLVKREDADAWRTDDICLVNIQDLGRVEEY